MPTRKRCGLCRQEAGHDRRNCPERVCCNCGMKGHNEKQCSNVDDGSSTTSIHSFAPDRRMQNMSSVIPNDKTVPFNPSDAIAIHNQVKKLEQMFTEMDEKMKRFSSNNTLMPSVRDDDLAVVLVF